MGTTKKIDINKLLCPEENELVINEDDGLATATILDAELDEVECTFNNDMCVQINTEDLSYVTLTVQNLYTLIELIEQADEHYQNYDFFDEDEK